jgi:hypothetical protein
VDKPKKDFIDQYNKLVNIQGKKNNSDLHQASTIQNELKIFMEKKKR